jgi:hypothetical protein
MIEKTKIKVVSILPARRVCPKIQRSKKSQYVAKHGTAERPVVGSKHHLKSNHPSVNVQDS